MILVENTYFITAGMVVASITAATQLDEEVKKKEKDREKMMVRKQRDGL